MSITSFPLYLKIKIKIFTMATEALPELPLLTFTHAVLYSFGCKQQKWTLISFRIKIQETIKYQGKVEQPRLREVTPSPGTSATAGGFVSLGC